MKSGINSAQVSAINIKRSKFVHLIANGKKKVEVTLILKEILRNFHPLLEPLSRHLKNNVATHLYIF